MTMGASYCTRCYRDLESDTAICPCRTPSSSISRVFLLLGIAGLPIMFAGVLALNVRLCVTGAVISFAAVLLNLIVSNLGNDLS